MANQQNQQKHIRILYLTSTTFSSTSPTPNFPAVENTIKNSLKDAIEKHKNGITVEFKNENIPKFQDLFSTLSSFKPSILVLFTHATDEGVYLNDGTHQSVLVPNNKIKKLIEHCMEESNLKCILLYACWSETLATELVSMVDCVIGMTRPITDYNVDGFTSHFFSAIGSGRSCSFAFDLAIDLIFDNNAAKIPVVKFKDGVDKAKVYPYLAQPLPSSSSSGIVIPDKVAASSQRVGDLSSTHIFRLASLLDTLVAGNIPAVTIAIQMGIKTDQVAQISKTKSPTESLIGYLKVYGTYEQGKLSYLYKKLMEQDPPMVEAAEVVASAIW